MRFPTAHYTYQYRREKTPCSLMYRYQYCISRAWMCCPCLRVIAGYMDQGLQYWDQEGSDCMNGVAGLAGSVGLTMVTLHSPTFQNKYN